MKISLEPLPPQTDRSSARAFKFMSPQVRQWLLLILIGLAIATAYRQYHQQPHYELRIFSGPAGWGYTVLNNGTALIYQPTIPGRNGSAGFQSEQQAQRVGERVVDKMQRGEMFPALSLDELRQLGVTIP